MTNEPQSEDQRAVNAAQRLRAAVEEINQALDEADNAGLSFSLEAKPAGQFPQQYGRVLLYPETRFNIPQIYRPVVL